ncbi:MAG: 3D domain-containing protein [Oribacterium sp.]|nr:3D domain-containing protein [Oribacterium sp.]
MNLKKAAVCFITMSLNGLVSVPAYADELGPAFKNGTQITMQQGALIASGAEDRKTSAEASDQNAQKSALPAEVKSKDADTTTGAAKKNQNRAGETPVGVVVTEESKAYSKGAALGNFQIVGYYGEGKTYSGAYTRANHTVAADTDVLPLGTKIFIGDTVYTVEDIGSAVKGNMIDIYFDSYEEAANVTRLGRRYADVYAAVKK